MLGLLFGFGAAMGAIAVGTVLHHIRKERLVRVGLVAFAAGDIGEHFLVEKLDRRAVDIGGDGVDLRDPAQDLDAGDDLEQLAGHRTGGDLLANSDALLGAETAEDGNAILADLYGSRDAAVRAMREMAPRLPEMALLRLAAIAAAPQILEPVRLEELLSFCW